MFEHTCDQTLIADDDGAIAVTPKLYASFHYKRDHSRVQQVLQAGVVEGQQIVSAQKWEEVKRSGKQAIENWIDREMKGKQALLVLVGNETAGRPWVRYEIIKAWNAGLPIVGVRIHGLKDFGKATDRPGLDPFEQIKFENGQNMGKYLDLKNPAGTSSEQVHASIRANLASWVAGAKSKK